MNINTITLETIRWTSILSILAVASYGFLTPITIIQALVYNPVLIIGLLSVVGYVSSRLEDIEPTADIHHLAIDNTQNSPPLCKAA
jgi:hypothetical protein